MHRHPPLRRLEHGLKLGHRHVESGDGAEQRDCLCGRCCTGEPKQTAHHRSGARREQGTPIAPTQVLDAVEGGGEQRGLHQKRPLGEQSVQLEMHVLGVDGQRLPVAREELKHRMHTLESLLGAQHSLGVQQPT